MARREITATQDGANVLVVIDGRATEMPWNVALDVARAMYQQAKRAEEYAKAAGIVFDQALLIRSGAFFGLSDHRGIQQEAAKEAAWNRDLRRYLPGGVKSKEQFGTPAVVAGPAKGGSTWHSVT